MSVFGEHDRLRKGSTDIWLTPLSIVRPLGVFITDPCAYINHPTARYCIYQNGLESNWIGRVWLNPPYSNVSDWLKKLTEHPHGGIALVFSRTDTKWFHEFATKADSIFFPKGRIKFMNSNFEFKGNSGAPSMFLSYKERPDWGVLNMQGWVAK